MMKKGVSFTDFETTSAKAWKQKIQFDLKGEDYNETLLWTTDEGITVKPFYTKEDRKNNGIKPLKEGFNICQSIFIDDEEIANSLAIDALKRGATAIEFKANNKFDYQVVLKKINLATTPIYFRCSFLETDFLNKLASYCNTTHSFFDVDIIGNLAKTGNWFSNLNQDHLRFEKMVKTTNNSIAINADLYQNAGADMVQQLAYTLAHANEYLNYFKEDISAKFHFKFALGSNYFFEIAKLRAFKMIWKSLMETYNYKNKTPHLFSVPSLRNKTLYDYNINMLRTTSESMSAILGGSNTICNLPYDALYHKSNEFGERIARNQLLILKDESHFKNAQHFAEGTYYIENLSFQLAEKALVLFKQIEKGGGFLKQLKLGTIQRKIAESATCEQEKFNQKELVLVGTNVHQHKNDKMSAELELYPFLKQKNSKTLISPILTKRLAENSEKERLNTEKNND